MSKNINCEDFIEWNEPKALKRGCEAYLGDCEISLSNDCVKFNYEVCESTKNDNKNVIVGNATVYLIGHSSIVSNPDLDKMWEIDTISYRKNITEKEMKTSSLKELASIPEEQITFSIRMIDDTPYMGLLRDGENEYDVDYTMNPNATGYTLYSGDFDEDGKKEYGRGQTASLNYRGTVFFYCLKAIVRECSTVDEMKCLKKHTKIKKDQYAEMQKLTSFPKEQISFYGLDMEKEDLLYIQIKNDLYVVDIPWEACVETEIVSGDYDHDGEKEIAVIVGSETLYIIEKGKRIKINKCPSIRQLDVPMVREYVKKENLNMSDELSFKANGDKLFYYFYVYSGEYGDLTNHGDYTNELIYYDDGKFDYSQKESDGYFDLGSG